MFNHPGADSGFEFTFESILDAKSLNGRVSTLFLSHAPPFSHPPHAAGC